MNEEIKIVRPQNDEMCEVGYHLVIGHERICKSGTKTWVDLHIRKNRGKKSIYLSENLLFLYWNNKKKNIAILNSVKGFPPFHELDPIIQFWLDYWKEQGMKFPDNLTPLHVKVLIAVESSFNVSARSEKSSAVGLMQILKGVRSALRATADIKTNEVKDHYIDVSDDQLEDPVVNIAVGTRWLAHKFFLIRNHKDKSLKKTIKLYHSNDEVGEKYATKILKLYEQSN